MQPEQIILVPNVKREHLRLMRSNPVRQMALFGADREQRRQIELRHNMYLLDLAIDNVCDAFNKNFDSRYGF